MLERFNRAVAWSLPRGIAYWCAVRVIAHATQGAFADTVVPELTAMDALMRWEGGRADRGPVRWNPWNKVVQDHRDGTIDVEATDRERRARGLQTPWTPEIGETECRQPGIA